MKVILSLLLVATLVVSGAHALKWYGQQQPAVEIDCDMNLNDIFTLFQCPLTVKSFRTEFAFGYRTRTRSISETCFSDNGVPQMVTKDVTQRDPVIVRFDNGVKTWCREDYEWSDRDNSAPYAFAWDDNTNEMYVAFEIDGGKFHSNVDFRRVARHGWMSTYGNGYGTYIPAIARINTDNGEMMAATYLPAETRNGITQSVQVRQMHLNNNGTLTLQSDAWWSPLKPDRTRFDCAEDDAPYDYTTTFSSNLEHMVWAQAYGCH